MASEKTPFLNIIDATPLVSVDLILKNPKKEVLLGRRVNRPARNFWFVPGGRIRKNETIAEAVKRVSSMELGFDLSACRPRLLGAFDHIYEDNYFNVQGINTHYVVLAFIIELDKELSVTPDDQHSELRWWRIDELLGDGNVHSNTKAYFKRP